MTENNTQTEQPEVTIPVKRTDGDTLEERLTDNAYHSILPARYLKKDEDGNLVETQEDLFKRVGRNVALAEAVFELNRQDETLLVTPDQIKPTHHARGELAATVFGFNTSEFSNADELPDDLDDASEYLEREEVELTEENVHKFAYDSIVPELPTDVQSHVEDIANKYTDMHENLKFVANSPTLMNAGDDLQQLSACFVNSPDDNMDDIHQTAKEAASTFQCLTEDSTVIEEQKGMISVSEVVPDDRVLQKTDTGYQFETVTETHTYEDSPTITVELENGFSIQGTPNHRLKVNGEWKQLEDVQPTDELEYALGWIENVDSKSPTLASVESGAMWDNNRKVTNEKILELYNKGLSDYQIAEELPVGKSTVQRRRSNELELPPNNDAPYEQSESFDNSKAISLYEDGKTDSQVSTELDITESTAQQFRSKQNITPNGSPVKDVTQPQTMTTQLAELVGLWAGDGSYHNDGVRFHISRENLVDWTEETVNELFDTTVSKHYADGCYEITINSHEIKRWWKQNFDVKSNGSQNVTVPTVISQSTPAEIKGYIRGYTTADGTAGNKNRYPVIYSSSEKSVDQIGTLLMGLNIPVKKSVIRDNSENPYYSVCPTTSFGRKKFANEIGFLGNRELSEVDNPVDTQYTGEQTFTVSVESVTEDSEETVYDLTVNDTHEYITDGIVSHNSGGGMGYAFWKLRPEGDPVGSSGGVSSGPITFMNTFDQMCETVAQGGTRRGAQMGVMRISHPDVLAFIRSKNKAVSLAHTLRLNDPDDYTHTKFAQALEEARELIDEDGKVPKHLRNAVEGHLSNFNISVGITDDFMDAVKNDEEYTFTNPRTEEPHIVTEQTKELYDMFGYGEYVEEGEVLSVPAREIWDDIIDGAHENGEPGVVYLERINKKHSFDVEEYPDHQILATNPCGEQPLEEYEACNLGHINFSTLVAEDAEFQDYRSFVAENEGRFDSDSERVEAFLEQAVDWDEFNYRIKYGTRFLENVVTMSDFPIEEITEKVSEMRKIGLGIMGYAQMLVQLGMQYGSEPANEVAKQMMTHMNHKSKVVSRNLAVDDRPGMNRGVFDEWDKSKFANPTEYQEWFEHHTGEDASDWEDGFPLRNHNTTTIAPTGTTSMVGNTTGGCEPMYNVAYLKNVSDDVQGDEMLVEFDDYFLRVLEANDVDVDTVKEEAKELMQDPSEEFNGAQDLSSVPEEIAELFLTTGELSGIEHASVQCAFQDGVDSSISKTANFPNDATKEDMREVYEYIYENGGKGVTVYRDGTRSKQVLTTRAENTEFSDADDFDEFLTAQIEDGDVTVGDVVETLQGNFDVRATTEGGELGLSEYRRRPDALVGMNQRINTGYGTLYVWISEDSDGNMFEVFASIGKSGGFSQSFTEALCRMISMSLRYGVPPERIVQHLSGIQSPKVGWENQEQVASVADGIAMAMETYIEYDGFVGLVQEMQSEGSELAEKLSASGQAEDDPEIDVQSQRKQVDEALQNKQSTSPDGPSEPVSDDTQEIIAQGDSPECPECGGMSLAMNEGCKTCQSCGWSEC